MQLVKVNHQSETRAGVLTDGTIHLSEPSATPISDFLESNDLVAKMSRTIETGNAVNPNEVQLLAPLDQQEVWAAGVTYIRSKSARMEESETAASCYDRVYVSPRPEIFFKATPHRVVGPDGGLRIRSDSGWNVPEPELTLVINSRKEFVGFTIGNDMSSRDIEGDNPLYLPQAKMYDECCGLGPAITPVANMPAKAEISIDLRILRNENEVFAGHTDASQMAREFEDLLEWLGRDNSFPHGAMLLTGTGIVPDSDFTLQPGDLMQIEVAGIGLLSNTVIQG